MALRGLRSALVGLRLDLSVELGGRLAAARRFLRTADELRGVLLQLLKAGALLVEREPGLLGQEQRDQPGKDIRGAEVERSGFRAVPAAASHDEQTLGDDGLSASGKLLRDEREREDAGVAVGADLLQEDRRLGHA